MEKKVAQVQFMVMELQQKNIVLVVIIMNFHGGQNVVHGNGIRTWVEIVVFQNQVQVNYLHGNFYYYTSLGSNLNILFCIKFFFQLNISAV